MKLKRTIFVFSLLLSMMVYVSVCAEDFDLGWVIEVSSDKSIIQVNDRTYEVGLIEILSTAGQPVPGNVSSLVEGALVKVIKGEKKESSWHADLITVYKGQAAERLAQEMELPAYETAETKGKKQSSGTSSQPEGKSILIQENGVWRN